MLCWQGCRDLWEARPTSICDIYQGHGGNSFSIRNNYKTNVNIKTEMETYIFNAFYHCVCITVVSFVHSFIYCCEWIFLVFVVVQTKTRKICFCLKHCCIFRSFLYTVANEFFLFLSLFSFIDLCLFYCSLSLLLIFLIVLLSSLTQMKRQSCSPESWEQQLDGKFEQTQHLHLQLTVC